MSHSSEPSRKGRGVAAFAAALAVASPGIAEAQQRPAPPPTAPVQGLYSNASSATRYATPDGAVRFVLDRTGGRAALVRFEGDPEVHVLRPVMAAGGGEIYRTEDGALMLHITPHGGIIVYTRALRTGAAASEEARVAPLTPASITFAEVQERFRRMALVARRAVGEPVTFTIPARMSAPVAGVIVDAAERATEGLAAAPMTNVRRVIISVGSEPEVELRGTELHIQVAPQLGYAGRPSSNTIRNVVSGAVQGPTQ